MMRVKMAMKGKKMRRKERTSERVSDFKKQTLFHQTEL